VATELSPPRLQPERPLSVLPDLAHVRPRTLHRSQSAMSGITLPPISTLTSTLPTLPPRLSRGRSRNVHAWEFCCDADVQDELITQAENESSGSALAAISLLRSTSAVLQPNGSKRNAPATKTSHRSQQTKRPKLSRTSSSVARMQTDSAEIKKPALSLSKEEVSTGDKSLVTMLASPGADSDKENWSPDEDGQPQLSRLRRPLPAAAPKPHNPRRAGRILQEHRPALAGTRSNTAPVARHRGSGKTTQELEIFEDVENRPPLVRDDDEVERFMSGEVSPSKKGDVLCVAGLLALSQGNWR
jgi:hypothetical protein